MLSATREGDLKLLDTSDDPFNSGDLGELSCATSITPRYLQFGGRVPRSTMAART